MIAAASGRLHRPSRLAEALQLLAIEAQKHMELHPVNRSARFLPGGMAHQHQQNLAASEDALRCAIADAHIALKDEAFTP